MNWSCGHHGYISADWLRKHQYPDASKRTTDTEPMVAVRKLIILTLGAAIKLDVSFFIDGDALCGRLTNRTG